MVSVTGLEMVLARSHPHPKPVQGWRDWARGWRNRTWESVDSFGKQTGKLARKNPLTAVTTLALGLAALHSPSAALSRLQQGITFLPRRGMQGITTLFRISPLGTLMVGGAGGARLCQAIHLLIQNPRQCQMIYEQARSDAWLRLEMPHVRRLLITRLSSPEDIMRYAQLWDQQVIANVPTVHPSTWSHLRELFDIKIALYRDIREKVESDGFSALDNYTPSKSVAEKIRQYAKCCTDTRASEMLKEAKLKSPYAKSLLECKTKEEFKRIRYKSSLEAHSDKTGGHDDEQQKWINLIVEHIRQEKDW